MNAFLIMCHKNPDQVIRLAKVCKTSNTDVFIHVDNCMSNSQYDKLKTLSKKEGFVVADKRLQGQLDHRSLVDIVMILIQTAIEYEKTKKIKYEYFALLSGQDYLIKPMWHIEDQLKILYPKPLIDCTPWDKKNWVNNKFAKSYKLLLYREWINNKFIKKKGFLYWFFRGIGYIWKKILQVTHRSDFYYFKEQNIKLYGGSAWWILPDKVIYSIYEAYKKNDIYINRLLETYTPEETFFQIMTMRTKYAKMVELNPVDSKEQTCKTYAYFSDIDKPFCGHPYTLTMENKDKFFNLKDYWFARKFDMVVDNNIFDYIDDNYLGKRVDFNENFRAI